MSDFIPPSEILAGLNLADQPGFSTFFGGADVPYRVKYDFLAPTLDPVKGISFPAGPTVNPTKTYEAASREGIQYDILWVPAGPIPDPASGIEVAPASEIAFIKSQAPGAKYLMSVCGGSGILANAGVLSGKKATTNKAFFRLVQATSPGDIDWVVKARWVVDGNIWTSSGVSAGSDMALAFVAHLAGLDVSRAIRGINEVTENRQDDDPFATIHGLT